MAKLHLIFSNKASKTLDALDRLYLKTTIGRVVNPVQGKPRHAHQHQLQQPLDSVDVDAAVIVVVVVVMVMVSSGGIS